MENVSYECQVTKNAFIQKDSAANIYVNTVCGQRECNPSATKHANTYMFVDDKSTKAFQDPVKYTVP